MKLAARLAEQGLYLRGVAELEPGETEQYGFSPAADAIALVGNVGSSYWPAFRASTEFDDGDADPLDRWSRRVAQAVAAEFSLQAIFPFEGPPYLPFQRWAARAEGLRQSPIGIMMHPEHGLWHSYRFALVGAGFDPAPACHDIESPCLACRDKPCLTTCPVEAFDGKAYDVDVCVRYLNSTPLAECHALGCNARNACPVAPQLRYLPEQARFHLQAFLRAQPVF
jgi:hypothetical protein